MTRGLVIMCLLLALVEVSVAKSRHFRWDVGYLFWSPDCLENVVLGINGQFPGPTIRAKVGDTIVVHLHNKLHTEGVVIHWHGIRQLDTPWADGTAAISQCPINPEDTFVYRFKVDRPGTHFYHGHYGMQRSAGLYGSMIVAEDDQHKSPFHYDGELNLLLSDWWHQSVHQQEVGLSSNPFRWIGEPQSILMNGRGQFNCSIAGGGSRTNTRDCKIRINAQCSPHVLRVLPNKTYRLRIASTTALASLNLAIGAPLESHWRVVKRILRYLKATPNFGLHIAPTPSFRLSGYCDADWASDPNDRRSTSGYCVYLGDNLISWSSKKQSTVSRSSTEAEYRSLASVTAELTWLQTLFTELRIGCSTPTIWCDNKSTVMLSANPVLHSRTKHIEIDLYFVREKVARKVVHVLHIQATDQVADVFTKAVGRSRFLFLRDKLSVIDESTLSLRGHVK